MSGWDGTLRRSVVEQMLAQAQEEASAIDRSTSRIETLEQDIVAERARRDEYRLKLVELRAAAQILQTAGLKVWTDKGVPNVSVERTFGAEATE